MNADKNDKSKPRDKEQVTKSADAVETPPPPQHMDPSKKPADDAKEPADKKKSRDKQKSKK